MAELAIVPHVKKFRSRGSRADLRSSDVDQELETAIEKYRICREKVKKVYDFAVKKLAIPNEEERTVLMRFVNKIVPRFCYRFLPASLEQIGSEEVDFISYGETLLRDWVNGLQGSLRELSKCAGKKLVELADLAEDMKQATEERWDAKDFLEYLAEGAGIKIEDEILMLLDSEFDILTTEEKEERKNELLGKIEKSREQSEEAMKVLKQMCIELLRELYRAAGELYYYRSLEDSARVARGAAIEMTSGNLSQIAARTVLKEVFDSSFQAIEAVREAADKSEQYSIASADMKALLISGWKTLGGERLRRVEIRGRNFLAKNPFELEHKAGESNAS